MRRTSRLLCPQATRTTSFMPLYGFSHHLAQLLVVGYGIYLIERGQATVGLLIGFLFYVNNLYGPMRQLATVWSSFQLALAGLDRISEVLALESNLPVIAAQAPERDSVLSFQQVWFPVSGWKRSAARRQL